jgi:hypothetical protein
MWWRHVLAFLAGVVTAVVCVGVAVWVYVEAG